MKYCSKCKQIHVNKEILLCPRCGKKLIKNPSCYSPINIVTANGFELERIKSALADSDIPFSINEERYDTGLQILNSAPPENCSFFIPLSHYDEAMETLIGIGAISEDKIAMLDKEDEEFLQKSREREKSEELSPKKAKVIRILSFLGFLIFLTLVAYFADYLLSFITPLLGW